MSLVNDMLRDLEKRRAAPGERQQLDGLYAVDEAASARREHYERLRRASIWFMAVMLIALLVGLMLGRAVKGVPPIPPPAATAVAPAVAYAQVLDVLPQHDERGLMLQLLLDRSVAYRRSEESGAVSLRLAAAQLAGELQQGRLQREGRSLSWRVENKGDEVQVLLVGLGDRLQVNDRLEAAGDRWMLWVEVPLQSPVEDDAGLRLDNLPEALSAEADEPEPPAWALAPVAPAPAANSTAARQAAPSEPSGGAPPAPQALSGPPQVSVTAYKPDALSLARQALEAGDPAGAVAQLEALQLTRGDDPQVQRWLARAYLAAGQQDKLLDWLPGQLAQAPQDSELRLLLARSQLQAGQQRAAVATLEQSPPALVREPHYFALLAAAYQQTGQWPQSAELYRKLVALSPQQATWQLGLGIALDQLGQRAEAGRHYRLALQGAGLDESSRRFASERAAALGGRG